MFAREYTTVPLHSPVIGFYHVLTPECAMDRSIAELSGFQITGSFLQAHPENLHSFVQTINSMNII